MLVALVGPESCGKTTLAKQLAEELSVPCFAEYAREYLELRSLGANYTREDVLAIARLQWEREQQAIHSDTQHVILDTDLLVIKIWWQFKYGECHPWIEEQIKRQDERKYLLLSPDIPWHKEALRENENDRQTLFAMFEAELNLRGWGYKVISGSRKQRLQQALAYIQADTKADSSA